MELRYFFRCIKLNTKNCSESSLSLLKYVSWCQCYKAQNKILPPKFIKLLSTFKKFDAYDLFIHSWRALKQWISSGANFFFRDRRQNDGYFFSGWKIMLLFNSFFEEALHPGSLPSNQVLKYSDVIRLYHKCMYCLSVVVCSTLISISTLYVAVL